MIKLPLINVLILIGLSLNAASKNSYTWTTDHMHIGVRWQPFGLEKCEIYDANRPLIKDHSSYAQFWVSWNAAEPNPANTDYKNNLSGYLKAIDHAVNLCVERGVHAELVMWHCPAWASENGKGGAWKPKVGEYPKFVTRMAKHFKGRVGAYQLYHEVNLEGMMNEADMNFIKDEIFTNGAKAIREVYEAEPQTHVIVSTSGTSPCQPCGAREGLKGVGAVAVDDYYDQLIADKELMNQVDALNLNISDHFNGYGMMDGALIPNCWTQYDLARGKLDQAEYQSKKILSSESWICWDGSENNHDVNADGKRDERDAFEKTITIFGKVLERGLNTVNMPWCDNSSRWSMGLTKRVDYSGQIKKLKPEWVTPANDGGPDVVTRKLGIHGPEERLKPHEVPESGLRFTEKVTSIPVTQTTCIIIFGGGTPRLPEAQMKLYGTPWLVKEEMTSPLTAMDLQVMNNTRFLPMIGPRSHSLSLFIRMVLQVLDFLRFPFQPPSKMVNITTMNSQKLIFAEKDSGTAPNTMLAPLPRILTTRLVRTKMYPVEAVGIKSYETGL